MPMRPYKTTHQGKEVSFACFHWRDFPPMEAHTGEDAERLRKDGVLDDIAYQRFRVWERVCGLLHMVDGKCRSCPHVRWVEVRPALPPMMVSLDGKSRVPIVDKTFITALPRARTNFLEMHRTAGSRHSKKNAAWVEEQDG